MVASLIRDERLASSGKVSTLVRQALPPKPSSCGLVRTWSLRSYKAIGRRRTASQLEVWRVAVCATGGSCRAV